ncbi:MAG: U32 family peptidase [Eubacterium sp.]|nr:U32 family peptidase [Eubacterium sp.]
MKILVPLSMIEYIDPYIQAGADELYFGFYDENWNACFGDYSDINRMSGFGKRANPYSFKQAVDIIKEIKNKGKKAFVTMNANGYSKDQICYMENNYFPLLQDAKVDGIILSDVNAIVAAVRSGLQPVASTMCAIYNSDIANVYYQTGVKRMILPRDLSLCELEGICKHLSDVKFEAFFMRNGCIFSDCYCLGMHRPECGATCTYTRFGVNKYTHDYSTFHDYHDVDLNDYLYRTSFHLDACAMCALYRLNQIGITALKIVGRADDFKSICRDIELTKYNIQIMSQSDNEREYLEKMVFPQNFPQKCRMGFSCYYPEVRF